MKSRYDEFPYFFIFAELLPGSYNQLDFCCACNVLHLFLRMSCHIMAVQLISRKYIHLQAKTIFVEITTRDAFIS